MPNRHDGGFLDLYAALVRDIVDYDPSLAVDMERDLSRIISNVKTRGLSVILKDLPEVGKLFELAISSGRLDYATIPFMGGYKHGTPIPRLFKGLWSRLFDVNGCRKQDIDPVHVFFMEQLCYMGKKYEVEPPPSALYETTEEFYNVDEVLPPPTLDWSGGSSTLRLDRNIKLDHNYYGQADQLDLFRSYDSSDTKLLDTIQRVADILSSDLGSFEIPSTSRHGRGAVYEDLHGVEKYSMSVVSSRLFNTFGGSGFFRPLGCVVDDRPGDQPSKLLAVPKTIKGPRLIAKEPVTHMYAQLSIMDWLYQTIPHKICGMAIDFTDQSISGQMALSSSQTQSHGTIDLKSASDRISLWLIERLFRANYTLLSSMADCRTQLVDLSIDKKLPSLHKLRKFTTQGSALTFPIQSIVFLMISVGAILHRNALPVTARNVRKIVKTTRIFGDDIIVPNDEVEAVILALEKLFLKVNTQKTHYLGSFRESCGVRAYNGVDVTPSYVTRIATRSMNPAEYKAVIDASNNFAKKWLFNLSNCLLSTVPKRIRDSIPFSRYTDRSIVLHSFSGAKNPESAKLRWNPRYQREEVRLLVQKTKKRRLKVDGSLLLEAFLALGESRPLPSFEGVDDWYPLSRWETRDVVSLAWVPLYS